MSLVTKLTAAVVMKKVVLKEELKKTSKIIVLNEDKDVNLKDRFEDAVEQITKKGKRTATDIKKSAKKITDNGMSKASDTAEQITRKGKKAFETVKEKVIHICEMTTKRKLREIMISKGLKKALVAYVNHSTNTVSIRDLDGLISVQGAGISKDVQVGTAIFA